MSGSLELNIGQLGKSKRINQFQFFCNKLRSLSNGFCILCIELKEVHSKVRNLDDSHRKFYRFFCITRLGKLKGIYL